SVSKHLPRPPTDKLYLTVAWSHRLQHCVCDFEYAPMSLSADVDNLATDAGDRSVNQRVQRLAMIFNIEPVSRHLTVAVHGQRLPENHTRDEARHPLFEMLVWPIVIERPNDDRGHVVSRPVRIDQTIRATLRRRIRTHRIERMLLAHLLRDCCSIDLGGRDVNESIDAIAMLHDSVCNRLRAEHVSLEEELVVGERAGDVRLGSHVHDDVCLAHERVHQLAVANVAV